MYEKIKLSVTLYNISANSSVCIEEQESLEFWCEAHSAELDHGILCN